MERSKLKNIIIIVLLLLNICLLLLVGGRDRHGKLAEEQLRQNTVSFLEKSGISVAETQIPWEEPGCVQMTQRSTEKEQHLAEAVLGKITDNSTGIAVEYMGEKGTARFFPDGRFFITMKEDRVEQIQDPEYHAQKYLQKLGFDLVRIDTKTEGNQTKVIFLQLAEGIPVFTCEIEVRYENGRLSRIQGWRLQGEVQPDNTKQEALETPTLLARFVSELSEGESSCSEIREITQGYLYSTGGLSSQSTLIPVWRVETDQGTLLLNCVTGKLESAEQWLH